MKKIIYSLTLILLVFLLIPKASAYTSKPLDYIEEFNIIVTTNSDATLNFDYELKWKVLDSTSEGPLEWVKIGIPNKYVDNIKVLSTDTIKRAYYYNDGGDTCIRLNLNKKYYKNEVVDMHFSFRQSHMFGKIKNGDNLVTYEYIPGWFDDIEIGSLTVKWDKTNVYYNEALDEDSNYLIWQTSLGQGAKTKIRLSYEKSNFPDIHENESYVGPSDDDGIKVFFIVIAIIIILVLIFSIINKYVRRASYYRTRGFYPYGRRFFFNRYFYYGVDDRGSRKVNPYVSSGGSGHSGHSCACACACACAGGGRAGCSKKDFYKGKKVDDVIDKLN